LQNRVIEIRAQTKPGYRGNDVVLELMNSPAMGQLQAELAAGYRVTVGGALEESQKSQTQMGTALLVFLFSIILLLIIQYNGFVKPLIILATLPLALAGALPGLFFKGYSLGFMSQLGILALFGIVLNAGIIFMEFADLLIKERASATDGSGPICGLSIQAFRTCLVDACKARLLPIFLTTSTTIAGFFPLALSGGPLWEGMAWCMIYGLAIGTVMTLLVVPALYAIFVETFGVKPFKPPSPLIDVHAAACLLPLA
jgi:multidrug efflux pump subunit AcrB